MGWKLNSLATLVHPNVYLGSLPFSGDVATLKALGVTHVVNMCWEWPGPRKAYKAANIRQCRIPTVDGSAPRKDDLLQGVAFILDALRPDRAPHDLSAPDLVLCESHHVLPRETAQAVLDAMPTTPTEPEQLATALSEHSERLLDGQGVSSSRVFVHCRCGMGRSAAMVIAFLMTQGWTLQEATRHLKGTRQEVDRSVMRYPSLRQMAGMLG